MTHLRFGFIIVAAALMVVVFVGPVTAYVWEVVT